jgi:AbrB family looped-hinge helix DNA binding protein
MFSRTQVHENVNKSTQMPPTANNPAFLRAGDALRKTIFWLDSAPRSAMLQLFNSSTITHMTMVIVTVKNKYQVVIPHRVRKEIGIAVGDVLEARAENGMIVFEPKSIVDRGIAESLEEFAQGRSSGPFDTHAAFLASLHKEAKRRKEKPKRSAK